jgi:hydrogenase-4 membrane subunit HyfE
MTRERALKIVLVVVGLFFSAAIYPALNGLFNPVLSDTGDTMQMAIYATLGVFLLLAVKTRAAHRSLIAFTAWSSFAHAAVMGVLGMEMASQRLGFLVASGVLVLIGLLLIVLWPRKQPAQQANAAAR